jgi:hypothetical protein
MKSIVVITIIFMLFVLGSCRKDQRKVNQLEGKWTVVWAALPDFGKTEPDLVFNFDWCKKRFDEFCDFSFYDFNLDASRNGIYSVNREGNTLTISFEDAGFNYFETFTIERLNFRNLMLKNTDPQTQFYAELKLRSIH